jgi:aerobic-type carbon monoxide dehydrogenase small subunit (CoxS/CutS family)
MLGWQAMFLVCSAGGEMESPIRFVVNGRPVRLNADGDRSLLWVLRTDLALTGAKYGCGAGLCGACTVLVGDRPVRSCITPLKAVAGKQVLTIEGLARDGKLHPLQQAFIDHGAFQCGYCTPGTLLSAYALLRGNPRPTRADITAAMDHHLCRCGAHQRIMAAIETAARKMGGTP